MSALSRLERECAAILARLRRLEEMPVPVAAELLQKPADWVRSNFNVIVHGPKSHHVRLADIEAYQEKRTVFPKTARYGAARPASQARRAA